MRLRTCSIKVESPMNVMLEKSVRGIQVKQRDDREASKFTASNLRLRVAT